MTRIYVGNLSFQTEAAALRVLFEPLGDVVDVEIITNPQTGKSRGYGFVQMDSKEAGQKAIEALNGSEFEGRTLQVNVAKPRPGYARDNAND